MYRCLVLLGLWLLLVACQPAAEPAAIPPLSSVLWATPTATAVLPSPLPNQPTAQPTLLPIPVVTDTAVPTVCVPVPPDGWVLTVVQSGNTLYGLARRGGTTVAELMRVNCRENDILYVGDLLYTSPGSGYTVAPPPPYQIILTLPPPTIPPAPPPCQTPPCEDDIFPTLPPAGDNGEPSLLPTSPPDELPLLPTLPPDGNEPAYP